MDDLRAPLVHMMRALDGAIIRLDELAYPGREKSYAKKHPIFLDFFRTDCKPCLKAMPKLVEMYEKHQKAGLEVVLIALLEDGKDGRDKLEKYLATNKLPFKVAVDSTENVAKMYLGDLVTLPASFLIGRTGTLERVKYGASGSYEKHFEEAIAKVLKQHKKAMKKAAK